MLKKIITAIFILLLIQSYTCGREKLEVVTSIAPLSFFIEKIGGDRVNVFTMVPAGGNPHTYEPTPRQMNKLSSADIFVKAGSGIEFELMWMDRIEALNKSMAICDASTGVTPVETNEDGTEEEPEHHHHGSKDPHIWLSPLNAIIITGNIRTCLAGMDPDGSEYYSDRASALVNELESLHQRISETLSNLGKRQFYIFHPAWAYFARDFNLEQIPVELSGKEPTPRRLEKLIKKAIKENIKVIFSSPQFSKKSAEVIAREIKGKVVFIDPMSEDYIRNLGYTAQLFRDNLK